MGPSGLINARAEYHDTTICYHQFMKKEKHPMINKAQERNVHKGHEAAYTIAEAETAVAVVESQALEVSLNHALHIDKAFASVAQRREGDESTAPRSLSWCTGNNPMFGSNGKTPLPAARGFFIDRPDEDEMFPDDYDLLDAMEQLVEQNKAREVVVEHYDKQGKPNRVPSWELYDVSLFVVCEGVPSKAEMERDNNDRWGIAYGWQPGIGGRSQVRFHCFIKELMDAGYNGLFIAGFSSFCTTKAIMALKAHDYVLRFADNLRAKAGDKEPVPFYAYALPIKCSTKTLTAGEEGKSREVYYPVPAIPRLSERDPEASLAYLAGMAITEDQARVLECNGRVEQSVLWSVRESARILAGKDGNATEEAPVNTAPISDINPPF